MRFIALLLLPLLLNSVFAQDSNITLDPSSGNYIIRYLGVDGQEQAVEFEPSTKIEPKVVATVTYSSNFRTYAYNYDVKNGINSRQRLLTFRVDHSASVDDILSPNNEWSGGVFSYRPTISWAHTLVRNDGMITSRSGIAPDSALSGFSIISTGLPAIVTCYFKGASKKLSFPDEPPTSVSRLLRPLRKFPANTIKATTIGPQNVPNPFIITSFLDTLIDYTNESSNQEWISSYSTRDKYLDYFNNAKASLFQADTLDANIALQAALAAVEQDRGTVLTSEAYALLRYNTEYILNQLPQEEQSGLKIKLIDSRGQLLAGGSLQYYDSGWKGAPDPVNGIFTLGTEKSSIKLRMTYANASQEMTVTVSNDTVIFKTIAASVQLKNSQGNLIDVGTVKYYAGGWRTFGTTVNGVATKELLPNNYKFRMTHAFATNEKTQYIGDDQTVIFQTVNSQVELRDSNNNLMDEGTVKYYSGGWRTFGTTSNGIATKELLPNNFKFRMTHAFASNEKTQNIGDDQTVIFQTVNSQVELRDSNNNLMDEGTVKYYSGGWRTFGTTSNGVAIKELLPNNYKFRMTHAFASNEKTQDISNTPIVQFSTVKAVVQVLDGQAQPINNIPVTYYSGGWRTFGTTAAGESSKELLPKAYNFRVNVNGVAANKEQNLIQNQVVNFIINL